LQLNEYLRESARLAELVQGKVAAIHPGEDRGVQQGPFLVLAAARRPSILVETGFATNQKDGAFLGPRRGNARSRWPLRTASSRTCSSSRERSPVPEVVRPMTRTRWSMAAALAAGLSAGCTYYNAMWSAKRHASDARQLERRGQPATPARSGPKRP